MKRSEPARHRTIRSLVWSWFLRNLTSCPSAFSGHPLIHLEKNPIPTVFRYETLVSTEGWGGGGGDSREFYCYCYWRLRMQRLQCGFSRTAQHILIKRKTKNQHWRLFAESDRLWQDLLVEHCDAVRLCWRAATLLVKCFSQCVRMPSAGTLSILWERK